MFACQPNHPDHIENDERLTSEARWIAACLLHLAEREVFAEDAERIERVRSYLWGSLAGLRFAPPPMTDFLFVLGALIDALGIDCAEPGVAAVIERQIADLRRLHRSSSAAPAARSWALVH